MNQLWVIEPGGETQKFATLTSLRSESQLEEWILNHPDSLEEGFRIIKQQPRFESGSRPDLLGITADGRIAVIEIKNTPIDKHAVIQAVDYAIQLEQMTLSQFQAIIDSAVACERFTELLLHKQKGTSSNKAKVAAFIVGLGLDASATRVVTKLRESPITLIELSAYTSDSGQVVIMRDDTHYDAKTCDHDVEERIAAAIAEDRLLRKNAHSELTLQGLRDARQQGRVGGRPTVWDENRVTHAKSLRKQGATVSEIAAIIGVSRASIYRLFENGDKREELSTMWIEETAHPA